MDPHAMGMQGGMSMPMSMGMAMSSGGSGGNPQGLGMNAMAMNPAQYGVAPQQQQQQQMMMNMNAMNGMNPMAMNSVGMQMNPNAMNAAAVSGGMQVGGGQSVAGADWRIQLTREHRANLIAKIYNQMVRVSADPVPGIKLWMNVSWYELTLYRESPTQEVYINKIFTRLKSLRAQQSDMNAAMAAQALPNQGMLSRLDFSYYNTLNQQNQRAATPAVNGGQVGGYPGHPQQFGGPAPHPGVQQQSGQAMASGATNGPAAQSVKPESDMPANVVAGYWRQHAALRAKHQDDVEKVHSAFKKYVDHMKGHDETEQKKKLRYLLSYVELCANILSEDKATHAPRKIEELDKVFKYIVKIVNPYLKKLRTETDKRSTTPGASTGPSLAATSAAATSTGANASSTNTSSGFSSAMGQQQQPGGAPTQQQQQKPGQQQNAATSAAQNQQASAHQTAQQKQQQYMMQQRAQQMQQRMQAQARQQQMMQQQQQHMMQQQKGPQTAQQQAQFANQQANQMKQQQQQNSQAAGNQQTDQQKQQQLAQQASQSQQNAAQQQQRQQQQQQQKPQQQQSASQQQQSQQQSGQTQGPPSRGESPSLSSGLGLGLDDSLYGGMGGDLLQMPTPSGSNSAYMDFPNALSPTNFSGMDLLDWEDGSAQGGSGQGSGNANTSGGDSSDLMTFVETL